MALEPEMNDPDWDRYSVAAPGAVAPVGDPTRWGSQVFTRLDFNRNIFTQQIIAASTRDAYARPWSLYGTVTLPHDLWVAANMGVLLECTMGVGQVQIIHWIVLELTPDIGLCMTQHLSKGGPYREGFNEPSAQIPPIPGLYDESRAFAAVGALVGQSISIRGLYITGSNIALPCTSRIALIVTPYATGEGL